MNKNKKELWLVIFCMLLIIIAILIDIYYNDFKKSEIKEIIKKDTIRIHDTIIVKKFTIEKFIKEFRLKAESSEYTKNDNGAGPCKYGILLSSYKEWNKKEISRYFPSNNKPFTSDFTLPNKYILEDFNPYYTTYQYYQVVLKPKFYEDINPINVLKNFKNMTNEEAVWIYYTIFKDYELDTINNKKAAFILFDLITWTPVFKSQMIACLTNKDPCKCLNDLNRWIISIQSKEFITLYGQGALNRIERRNKYLEISE